MAAVASVAAAVGLGELLDAVAALPNLSMIFLTAVLFCAVRFGLRSAVARRDPFVLRLRFLLHRAAARIHRSRAAGILRAADFPRRRGSRRLARRPRARPGASARDNARTTQSMFELSRKLSGAVALDDILLAATIYMHKTLGARCVVMMLPEDGELDAGSAWPPIDALSPGETSAARWAFEKGEAAGWRTGTLPNVRFQFRPLVTTRGVVGVCGFEPADPDATIAPTRSTRSISFSNRRRSPIDRAQLVKDSVKTAALEENEKLRTTLLSSLSHDLRTPLASITGAVTTLRQFGEAMAPEQARRSPRLDRGGGGAADALRRQSARHVAHRGGRAEAEARLCRCRRSRARGGRARAQGLSRRRASRPASRAICRSSSGDANLLEQVLFNLLDNAQKYGGGGRSPVHARRAGAEVLISVTDEGPGVKPADLERIFEKFYQGGRSDGRKAGVGLGLSIAKRPGRGDGRRDLGRKPGGAPARHAHRHRVAGRRGARACEGGVMSGLRILVVDDEPQILRFLRPALEASGYDVLHAATGARRCA